MIFMNWEQISYCRSSELWGCVGLLYSYGPSMFNV